MQGKMNGSIFLISPGSNEEQEQLAIIDTLGSSFQ